MRIYAGFSALSEFRQSKLLARLRAVDPTVASINAAYVHFADVNDGMSATDELRLKELLTYGPAIKPEAEGELFLIVPRPGTISPWSSKATDIAHNSGLSGVNRLERGVAYYIRSAGEQRSDLAAHLHDRMTESVLDDLESAAILFDTEKPKLLGEIDILGKGKKVLERANRDLALALTDDEIEYLYDSYVSLKRNPTDTELMMFGVVNSEHCRHKIFNADWAIDGKKQPKSLFKMIRNTYEKGGEDVLSAYSDNAAVLKGAKAGRFFPDPKSKAYQYHHEPVHTVIKVETHNHPTAIAPIPGAATGIGGEIRDEAATGRGAKTKMGLAGFSVSNLEIPGSLQPWENPYGKPGRIVSALDIMLEAPIGGAAYANEFGRPNVAGYFRTYQQEDGDAAWGYHKPIMIAGGLGNIRDMHVKKEDLKAGDLLIVLGGPAMLIGLAGGTASSMEAGASNEDLDFSSVQRANAEIERRCQEVVDTCWALGKENPIVTIHDVGAGGLSNAFPELVHDSGLGGTFELRDVPSAEPGLSPMEIWSNESQERYVLGIRESDLSRFRAICERERCPFAVVGRATKKERLVVTDKLLKDKPIDLPMSVLFGKPPKMTRNFSPSAPELPGLELDNISLEDAAERVLKLPAVGSKKFLITIGDRNVGGLITRDQMVGPWQVPVSDVAVAASAFDTDHGEAMAMGERTPVARIDAAASARIAVGEAITNLAAADIEKLPDIKLSANWMAAAGSGNEDENLYRAVEAVGEEFCPALGLTIPVGKDSLSMRTAWQDGDKQKSVTSPLSLIISGFAPVQNVTRTLTPQLDMSQDTALILVDLGQGRNRLGGSALAQVYGQLGNEAPDITPKLLKNFFACLKDLKRQGNILAYHDRSDGGLFAVLAEMAFASRSGLNIDISKLSGSALEKLFNEELGAVLQVKEPAAVDVIRQLKKAIGSCAHVIGRPTKEQAITINHGEDTYCSERATLEKWWSDTSYQIQKLRDDPESAEQEAAIVEDAEDPGLQPHVTFEVKTAKYRSRPKVAIFREQGVNGQVEMAAAFDRAGFTSVDVHLQDILQGRVNLDEFVGLAACGGFSYGDVLGAGEGWAKSILFDEKLRDTFKAFFERPDTFSLGVCNGCQMLAALKELIPGAQNWPVFLKNKSEQFEARLTMVKINDSPSILLKGMAGSLLPVPVAHGEGRAKFLSDAQMELASENNLVAAQYADNRHQVTTKYPFNPNGSPQGITALTTPDGRATILMPHPERAFLTRQLSWHPSGWGAESPWFRLFVNAREWVAKNEQ